MSVAIFGSIRVAIDAWSADTSAGYVRTYRLQVERVQAATAQVARTAARFHDAFDEEELFVELGVFLRATGVPEHEIEAQVSRLRFSPPVPLPCSSHRRGPRSH